MSYTLTIEAPENVATFETLRSRLTDAQLSEFFLAFLAERVAQSQAEERCSEDDRALVQWDELVSAGKGRLKEPYRFSRADAYEGITVHNPFCN